MAKKHKNSLKNLPKQAKLLASNLKSSVLAAITRIPSKPEMLEEKLFAHSLEGLSKKEEEKVDKKISEFSKYVERAEELDAEIVRLQQASRTSFKAFRKLHVYLCVRNKLYNHLHSTPYASQFNAGALGVYVIALVVGFGAFYSPLLQNNNQPLFVNYIKASNESDTALFGGDNSNVTVGFSDKQHKTAGIVIMPTEDRVKNADRYQLGVHLLADGLEVPAEKQLGATTTLDWLSPSNNRFALRFAQGASAQNATSVASLPASTVANVEVEQNNPEVVTYHVTDDLIVRYHMTEWKTKETIVVKRPEAMKTNTLVFALNDKGLIFEADDDGSWQAFKEEDKGKTNQASAVFRLHKPTVEDKNGVMGEIKMDIEDGRATYTINQDYLKNAAYPLLIDPTISPSGRTCTWSRGASTAVWATAGNWSCTSGNGPPVSGDAVVFDSTSNTDVSAAAGTVADDLYSVSLNSGYASTVTLAAAPISSNDGTPNNYKWDMETLTINAGTLALTGDPNVNPDPVPAGCSVSVKCGRGIEIAANDVTVGASGTLTASRLGFAESVGPGKGTVAGQGSSHGGEGGGAPTSTYTTYGSITDPNALGSGGIGTGYGAGGRGGGAIILTVSGTTTIDGTVSADAGAGGLGFGGNGGSGGSGGSIKITSGTVAGAGVVSAKGGSNNTPHPSTGTNGIQNGSGGGGGRIAIIGTTVTFNGTYNNYGDTIGSTAGLSTTDGAAGTTYVRSSGQTNGTLIVDNNGYESKLRGDGAAPLPSGTYTFDVITLKNKGNLRVPSGVTLDISNTTIGGDGNGILTNRGTLTTGTSLTISNYRLAADSSTLGSVTNLTVDTGGVLTHSPNNTSAVYALNLTLQSLTLQNGGKVDVAGKGFAAASGPGTATGSGSYPNSGGAHGGLAYSGGGNGYGSVTDPTTLGSGGMNGGYGVGGPGGGSARLTVSGTLSVGSTSSIVAHGQTNAVCGGGSRGGAGAAGSVNLNVGTLSGSGTIAANGADVTCISSSSSGGGGRVAIVASSSTHSGTVSTYGGLTEGSIYAGAGTIYRNVGGTKTISIDNNARSTNGGTVISESTLAGNGTLTITNGGILSHAHNTTTETYKMDLTVDDVVVTSTGAISTTGKGYRYQAGPGYNSTQSGGSHGGRGANPTGASGATYGSATAPVTIGSGGYHTNGGAGGGAIKLTVTGSLTNAGTISSNAATPAVYGAGGAGGSVWIIGGTVTSSGTISATGSAAATYGPGSGGGGRIAITTSSHTLTGTISAAGGGTDGKAGTVILPASMMGATGDLTLGGTGNLLSLTLGADVAYTFRNLTINSGGSLVVDTNPFTNVSCAGGPVSVACGTGGIINATNITVASGGSLHSDERGFPRETRTAPGISGTDSGGTHGGVGTSSTASVYGDPNQPVSLGSACGRGEWGQCGAGGGGALKLVVSGTLTNQGRISSNGASGSVYSTGAAGGSVWIITGNLLGNGAVEAKGSTGGAYSTAGGGGGRVAIYVTGTTDTYSGTKVATGGTNYGTSTRAGDGTVVTQHYPSLSVTSPTASATNQSQNLAVNFSATDSESDYYFAKIEISTNSGFSSSCVLTQTATTSTFAAGSCSGDYASIAGAFTNMNYDSNSNSSSDAYTSGRAGTFTFSSDLTQGTVYYIRMSVCDAAGACGSMSSAFGTADERSVTIAPISKVIYTTNGSDTTCVDTSSAQTVIAHQVSSIFTAQICNAIDEAVKMTSTQAITLASTSGTGTFSTSSSGSPTLTSINVASGASSATFYYKDTTISTPTLTATPTGQGWTVASQQQTIKSDTPVRLNLTVGSSPTQAQAGSNLTITISAYDQYENVATDFTGAKLLRFSGANNAPGAPGGGTSNPTVTNSSNTPVAFGSDTAITFTNGVSQSRTMVLKLLENASIVTTDFTSGSAAITSLNNPYAIQIIPGDLSYFGATKYPQTSIGQFATAGFPWNSTGLAGGNQAPYDVVVTAHDAYSNIKYDYTGPIWFTMDEGKLYTFPFDSVSNAYTFTWNGDHNTHPIRSTTSNTYDHGRHIFSASTFTVTSGGSSQAWYLNGGGAVVTTLRITVKPSSIGRIGINFTPDLTSDLVDTTLNSDVMVTAYDVLGNVKTDYLGDIAFSTTDTLGTLPYIESSKYTFLDTDLGTHTFDKAAFQFGTGGNHTITVTDNTSDVTTTFTDTTNPVVVPVHPATQFSVSAGHEGATLSWRNPVDPAVSKANIYQSTTSGVLGTKLTSQPSVTAGAVSQFKTTGLTNGTMYYYTIKLLHLNPEGAEVESTASSQVSVLPADVAPREVTASQGTDGRITITYGLRFESTISISYYDPTANEWRAASAGAISGDVGAGISGSADIEDHTAYFTPSVDFANKYYTGSQGFKVSIDVEAQGTEVQGESNNLLLDTNPPRVNTGESLLLLDGTGTNTATLTLLAREDGASEQAIQYRISNNSDMSGATEWTTLATKPTTITNWNIADSAGVTVQYRDPYNNITKVTNTGLGVPQDFGLKDGSNTDTGDYRLLLIWTDPEISNFSRFLIDRSTDGTSFTQVDTSNKNGYLDVNLVNTQRYYYRVKTQDTAGNVSRPTAILNSQPGGAPGVTAKPDINVQAWKQEFGVRATVKWSTDQLSDSFVVFAKKPLAEGTSTLTTDGEAAQVVGQFDKTLDHEVLVQQLEPSTDYYFKTLSQNEIKIAGASEIVKLTTPERIPLTVSGLTFQSTTPSSTQVVWTTNKPSTTVLQYGTSTDYGSKQEDKNPNIDHTFTLDKLTSGTSYNIRVLATDVDGNTTTSDNYKVTIPAIPTVSDVRVSELSQNTATVVWNSNVNSDSNVEFGETTTYSSQQGKSDTTTLHTVVVIGLKPATTYNYRVRSADAFGNVATSSNLSFVTPRDAEAPAITNVKGELSTTGEGDKLKITGIISWDTNEPATSQIEYGAGVPGEFPEKTAETATFNQSSTLFLRELKPNSSYNYRVVAKDATGNVSRSEAYTLLTPARKKDIGALLLQSLRDQFKWVNRLQDRFKK